MEINDALTLKVYYLQIYKLFKSAIQLNIDDLIFKWLLVEMLNRKHLTSITIAIALYRNIEILL